MSSACRWSRCSSPRYDGRVHPARSATLFTATYDGPVTHQPEEVAWGGWMTSAELRARLADPDWPFVPDGRVLLSSRLLRPAQPALTALASRPAYRYWPVLATVSIDRPASVPCLPWMSVRM